MDERDQDEAAAPAGGSTAGDRLPPEHLAQCQGNLWVAEREWIDFVSYWPKMPLFVKRVYRDEIYIKNLAAEVDLFNSELDTYLAVCATSRCGDGVKLWLAKITGRTSVGMIPTDDISKKVLSRMADGECAQVELVRPVVCSGTMYFGICRQIGLNQDPQRTEDSIDAELRVRGGHFEVMLIDGHECRCQSGLRSSCYQPTSGPSSGPLSSWRSVSTSARNTFGASGMKKAESARIERMLLLGCCACAALGIPNHHVIECHHILSGGRRMGIDSRSAVPRPPSKRVHLCPAVETVIQRAVLHCRRTEAVQRGIWH